MDKEANGKSALTDTGPADSLSKTDLRLARRARKTFSLLQETSSPMRKQDFYDVESHLPTFGIRYDLSARAERLRRCVARIRARVEG